MGGEGYFQVGGFRGGPFGDANDDEIIYEPLGASYGYFSADGFIARYAPNGDFLWMERIKGAAADGVLDAVVLDDGDLLLVGGIGRRDILPATFFPGHPAEFTVPASLTEHMFLMRLDFSGDPSSETPNFTVDWIKWFGGHSWNHELSVSPEGDLYVAGHLGEFAERQRQLPRQDLRRGADVSPPSPRPDLPDEDRSLSRGTGSGRWAPVSRVTAGPASRGLRTGCYLFTGGGSASLVDSTGSLLGTLGYGAWAKLDRSGQLLWSITNTAGASFSVTYLDGSAFTTGGHSRKLDRYRQLQRDPASQRPKGVHREGGGGAVDGSRDAGFGSPRAATRRPKVRPCTFWSR